MPLPTQTLARALAVSRAFFRGSFPGKGMGARQFLGQLSRATGLAAWSEQKDVEYVDNDIVPSAQSSKDALSAWAFLLGLPDGQGGYGRLVATTASGGLGNLTGIKGTAFTTPLTATAPDGKTQISLVSTVTISGSPPGLGSVQGTFVAVLPGSTGNVAAGTTMTWDSPAAGSDPTFVLTGALSNGFDLETNAQVFARILARLQNPPRGGTSADYTLWAEAVATITGVYVYGRRSGTGTVDVVITVGGTGVGRAPSIFTVVPAVQAMIDALRPVNVDGVNVMPPFMAATGHAIRARVTPSGSANAFDWGADATWTGIPFTVNFYTPGTPASIELQTLAPLSLKTAITAYINSIGPQPRLQVISSGIAVNPPVGTSKTIGWADAGSRTTITLDTLPAGWIPPTIGDAVFPYGPVVGAIAAAELALIDGLGPSRVSGYGDTLSNWQDTLAINQIARVAEDAADATGAVLVDKVIAGGATIDGSSAADLQATDASPTQAPELLYASSIAVTP